MDSVIIDYIRQHQPESLLECTGSPWTELEQFCRAEGIRFLSVAPQQIADCSEPIDLAVVHDTLETLGATSGEQILGHLRNSLTKRIWLLMAQNAEWPLHSLVALGFKKDKVPLLTESQLQSYTYDINSYNHKRTWNNSRFWANPENFNKFRW